MWKTLSLPHETATIWSHLTRIDTPADLRALALTELPALADELRAFLLHSVARTGGHLAAGLGTVELALALHYVFDTPHDRLVWDTGHQAYPHKVLTGRRNQFHTLRQAGGLSGFPRREESAYDTFGVGHSSTSLSAATGMALAKKLRGEAREIVAVIGDGALTAGIAFEALNHAGDAKADMLVILNDNEMSISPNVGALSSYLARILSGQAYTSVRAGGKTVLGTVPPLQRFVKRWEEHLKGMLIPSTLFEELGFYYVGPVDGHDLPNLIKTLRNLKAIGGRPRFLHVVTQKGKGYAPAEGNPCDYHGVTPFDLVTGKLEKKAQGKTYTQVFGAWLCAQAAADPKLAGITPAMREGSGLVQFAEQFPARYFDVGIAEQHALTLAAGMACEGLKPVVAIYSSFLQRAYDQLIHDICLQNLDVTLAIDRAGLVGADGATHAGQFDLSFLRCIPNLVIMAPADEDECWRMLSTAYQHPGPAAVRYPRGTGPGVALSHDLSALPLGQAQTLRSGHTLALLAFGSRVAAALTAGTALEASVVNMRFIKPLDTTLIAQLAQTHTAIVTVEENALAGGAGSAVNEVLIKLGYRGAVLNLGLPDSFIEHGEHATLLSELQLDAPGILAQIQTWQAKS